MLALFFVSAFRVYKVPRIEPTPGPTYSAGWGWCWPHSLLPSTPWLVASLAVNGTRIRNTWTNDPGTTPCSWNHPTLNTTTATHVITDTRGPTCMTWMLDNLFRPLPTARNRLRRAGSGNEEISRLDTNKGYTPNGYIVTSKFCVYFIPCMDKLKAVSKQTKMCFNYMYKALPEM